MRLLPQCLEQYLPGLGYVAVLLVPLPASADVAGLAGSAVASAAAFATFAVASAAFAVILQATLVPVLGSQ